MAAVDVGVGHDDHLVIAELLMSNFADSGASAMMTGISLSLPYTLSARAFSTFSICPRARIA